MSLSIRSWRRRTTAMSLAILSALVTLHCSRVERPDRDALAGTFKDPGEFMAPRDLSQDNEPVRICPDEQANPRRIVEIREADPLVDRAHHDLMLKRLADNVGLANTTVLLGPNVVLDFSHASDEQIPLSLGPCVTLMSVDSFPPDTVLGRTHDPGAAIPSSAAPVSAAAAPSSPFAAGSARTPHSLGPVLKFGPHRDKEVVFLEVRSIPEGRRADNVRISGFRLFGPSFDEQDTGEIGIQIDRSLNVEVSNMEIAGFGGIGIQVVDAFEAGESGHGQQQPNNVAGDRIGAYDQVKIFNNYIHHNQRPRGTLDSTANGYGVSTNDGSWAQIYENLFDFNRHAIEASGDAGGYEARRNLVLKGGGIHYSGLFTAHTHQFDIHGSGSGGFGGQASVQTWYSHNAFQYLNGHAIEIRARPKVHVYIHDNIFAHEGLENDRGDDAIALDDRDDLDVIDLGPNNSIHFDPYGRYGVGDFDGDGVDDLFLATGRSWWFSSFGEFPWSYLNLRTERFDQLRLGYFDADLKCDVLTEIAGEWVISSAGIGPPVSLGTFGVSLNEVVFGRFDSRQRDQRAEATRRTTHAFRRTNDGQWFVTPLTAPDWRPVASSSFPLSKLRFGDFTGDGVTDVLAVENGRWAISESARSPWKTLNSTLSDNVRSLYFADLNHNNMDDILKLERKTRSSGTGGERRVIETLTWWVSEDGRTPWRELKTHTLTYSGLQDLEVPAIGFAGRFGVAPGGGILTIDHDRIGHFFSEAESLAGRKTDWTSLFAY